MKSTKIGASIQAQLDLLDLVEQATVLLERLLGESAPSVAISWDLEHDDRDRPILKATLSDWTGEAKAYLTPEELRDPAQSRWRLRELWGDLLQIRSHKLLDELRAIPSHAEDR